MPEADMANLAADALLAAHTIDRLNAEYECNEGFRWSAQDIRNEIPHIEAAARDRAEREARVEELAQGMALVLWECLSGETKENYRRNARKLIENGWTKE